MPLDIVVTRFVQQNVGGLRKDLSTLSGDFLVLESHIARSEGSAARVAAIGALAVGAVASITRKSLQAYGEVQRVETGFMTIFKDAKKVKDLSDAVRKFDVETPFSYLETARSSQMLLAAGFRSDLIPTMRAIANATISAGKGTDTFVRALAIMAKIRTTGVLTGIRVNQFAAAGINIKDILKKQLHLTDDQMINIGKLHLKADVVIPAINKGLMEAFGGGIENAKKSYLGSLEVMKGQTEKTFASIGKTIEGDATKIVHSVTKAMDVIDKFVTKHPTLTKGILGATAIGGTTGVVIGAVSAFKLARMAKEALTIATNKDSIAEGTKAVVAGTEAAAIGRAGRASRTAAAASAAAAAAAEEGAAASMATGVAAGSSAQKISMLAKSSSAAKSAMEWMKRPLKAPLQGPIGNADRFRRVTTAADVAANEANDLRLGRTIVPPSMYRDTVTGKFAKASAVRAYEADLAAMNASKTGVAGWAGRTTIGHAAGSVAGGAFAGYDAYSDYNKMGDDNAKYKGAVTGIAAAMVSLFVPGGPIAVGLASIIRLIVDQGYNKGSEKKSRKRRRSLSRGAKEAK